MIKRLLCSALGLSSALITLQTPVSAKYDPGTVELLQTVQRYGATVEYNPTHCRNSTYSGRYTVDGRLLSLCYSGRPSANDYDTVRHEAWHFLQHCSAIRRGYGNNITPVARQSSVRLQWVQNALTRDHIHRITTVYPAHTHAVELEAFAAADYYTAAQIAQFIRQWC